jgi:hypothetical protein
VRLLKTSVGFDQAQRRGGVVDINDTHQSINLCRFETQNNYKKNNYLRMGFSNRGSETERAE